MKKEFNHIDDLLRDSLDGYSITPSRGVWHKIVQGLMIRKFGFYMILFVLVIGTGILVLLFPSGDEPKTEVLANSGLNEVPVKEPESVTLQNPSDENMDQISANKPVELVADHPKTNPVIINKENDYEFTNANTLNENNSSSIITDDSEDITNTNPPHLPVNHFETYPGLERLEYTFNSDDHISPLVHSPNQYPGIINSRNQFKINTGTNEDYGFRKSKYLMLQFYPELIFTREAENNLKKSISLDLSYVIEGREGFIQVGAGLGISEDDGNFKVNYSQYDSIGYYYKVGSFTIDPVSGTPVFQTIIEGLYDTLDYSFSQQSDNYYYYFRVPVLAGLKVYEWKRISMYAEAGGTYSVLVKNNESGINYINDRATSIDIIDNTPKRIRTNIQLSLGVGLHYSFSNKIGLKIDGLYNHFWNPIFERQYKQKSPYSVGLKAGLIYKL